MQLAMRRPESGGWCSEEAAGSFQIQVKDREVAAVLARAVLETSQGTYTTYLTIGAE